MVVSPTIAYTHDTTAHIQQVNNIVNQNKMAKEYTKIELTESDIKQMVAEKYKLDINRTTINVSHYAGDAREPAYTSIVVTGQRDGDS